MHSYTRGVLFCLVATISWGAMFPIMTDALTQIDPFTFTSLRYGIAGLAFLVLLLVREGRAGVSLRGERLLPAWVFGTLGFAGFGFLVFLGQQMAGPDGALTASIMIATVPMLGLLVNWVARKAAPPLYSFLFILVSFSGVLLVITKGDLAALAREPQSYGANGLIVLGALSFVIYTVGAIYYPRWSTLKYTTVTTLLGVTSVFAINAALFAARIVPVPSVPALRYILPHLAYMAFIAGFIGVLSWNVGNKLLGTLNGVLFSDVVPLTAFTVSAIEGIVPTYMQLVGAALTGLALICNNLYLRHVAAVARPAAAQAVPPRAEGRRAA